MFLTYKNNCFLRYTWKNVFYFETLLFCIFQRSSSWGKVLRWLLERSLKNLRILGLLMLYHCLKQMPTCVFISAPKWLTLLSWPSKKVKRFYRRMNRIPIGNFWWCFSYLLPIFSPVSPAYFCGHSLCGKGPSDNKDLSDS